MFIQDIVFDVLLRGVMLSGIALTWVIILVRVVGLRSFSKMTAFDFVVTLAVGSLLAGAAQATEWTGVGQSLVAMAGLLTFQFLIAKARYSSDGVERTIANCPRLLMRDGEIFAEVLEKTRVTRADLYAKLREANALDFDKVRAVVLETTGDIAVLHGDAFDNRLLEGIEDEHGKILRSEPS